MTHPRLSEKERGTNGELTVGEQTRRHQVFLDQQPLTVRCAVPDCGWVYDGTAGYARAEAQRHRETVHPSLTTLSRAERKVREIADSRRLRAERDAASRGGLGALERMDAGEPQVLPERGERPGPSGDDAATPGTIRKDAPAPRSESTGPRPRGWWTRERVVEAIKEKAAELGRTPKGTDMHSVEQSCKRLGWTWSEALLEAGFEPRRSGRKQPLDPAGEKPGGDPPAGSSGPGVDEQVVTSSATDTGEAVDDVADGGAGTPPPVVPGGHDPAEPVDGRETAPVTNPEAPLVRPGPLARTSDAPGGASPAPRHGLLLILEGLRDLVDVYWPEP